MAASLEEIKELREMTSCGVIECKKALEEASGDFDKAKEILRKRGLEIAAKKGNRVANEGRIEAYVHLGSKIGVLLEVNCETDFVAKTDAFKDFTKDLAMHIAAMDPQYIKKEDVPNDVLAQQQDQKIFLKENCLLEQAFVKNTSITVQDYLNSLVVKIGENISVSRFIRYKVGEAK
ncbi:MAG: translation elongation factor Ts [Candidatus Omnitrophota bacterium]